MNILKHRSVQASAAAAVTIGVAASIGADRFPAAFAAIGALWAVCTVLAVRQATRAHE
jgi:hypothetical protein